MDKDKIDNEVATTIREECNSGNEEGDHAHADQQLIDLLRFLGYNKTVDEWEKVKKLYS